jgi:hypothetical protein
LKVNGEQLGFEIINHVMNVFVRRLRLLVKVLENLEKSECKKGRAGGVILQKCCSLK